MFILLSYSVVMRTHRSVAGCDSHTCAGLRALSGPQWSDLAQCLKRIGSGSSCRSAWTERLQHPVKKHQLHCHRCHDNVRYQHTVYLTSGRPCATKTQQSGVQQVFSTDWQVRLHDIGKKFFFFFFLDKFALLDITHPAMWLQGMSTLWCQCWNDLLCS